MSRISILFVCLGNICRSPTAAGVLRQQLLDQGLDKLISVDSAGTGDWHIGSPPDRRAQLAANSRGFDISDLRARQVSTEDFVHFDYLIAMDHNNRKNLLQIADPSHHHKVRLLLEFSEFTGLEEVPDPYYGGDQGFDQVIDLIEAANLELIKMLTAGDTSRP